MSATEPWTPTWRRDWPRRGAAIDPAVDDLPHPACGCEWWYFHAHLTAADSQHSLVLGIFRRLATIERTAPLNSHWVVVGHTDHALGVHSSESWLDGAAHELLRRTVARDAAMDTRVRTSLLEALGEGHAIAPDRLLRGDVCIAMDDLDIRLGDVVTLGKRPDGSYRLTYTGDRESFDLALSATKPHIPEFADGAAPGRFGGAEGDLYAYFAPRMAACGRLGRSAVSGEAWFEHAFGSGWRPVEDAEGHGRDTTWMWVGLQLDNGWDLAAMCGEQIDGPSELGLGPEYHAVASSPVGDRVVCDVEFVALERWTSMSSCNSYPVRLALTAPALELDLVVDAAPHQQEIRTMLATGAAYEASVTVSGTMAGEAVRGRGFLEVLPSNRVHRIESFLERLHETTNVEVRALYPDQPSEALTAELIGADASGLPHRTVQESLVAPTRHVADAAGKGWRTYAACAAIELFDVRAEHYLPMLAAVELTHSACLMVDDVEDGSPSRRGVAAAHVRFGTPIAINAGTAAYFVLDRVLPRLLPDDDGLLLRAYGAYLRAMRAAHVGQGIDLAGHREAMDLAVATGDSGALLAGVRGALRLKTGALASAFGEVGALIARADHEQVRAVGRYYEAVGLAYQITDDVLDVVGAAAGGGLDAAKHNGEDLRHGKVTMPFAHSVDLLPRRQLADIWAAVRGGNVPECTVREVAATLVACGAIEACYDDAKMRVDDAWATLEPLLPNSLPAVMVRALGFWAALREYAPATPTPAG